MKKLILYICLALFIAVPVYGQQVRPSYKQGFARGAGESVNPNLWKSMELMCPTSLGVTGISTLRDISGFSRDGNLQSMIGSDWVVGEDGYALTYDGSANFVNFPLTTLPIGQAFTIVARIKATSSGSFKQIICSESTTTVNRAFQFRLDATTNVLRLVRFNSAGSVVATFTDAGATDLGDGQWHTVGATFSTAVGSQLFIDGVPGTTDSDTTANNTNLQGLEIGRNDRGNDNHFLGQLGNTFIYSARLSNSSMMLHHTDPNAIFRLVRRVFRAPDAAPAGRRIMIISQYINDLVGQCYKYN